MPDERLLNYGAIGIILFWFIWRAERSFERIIRLLVAQARVMTLMSAQLNSTAGKRERESIIAEIDDVEKH